MSVRGLATYLARACAVVRARPTHELAAAGVGAVDIDVCLEWYQHLHGTTVTTQKLTRLVETVVPQWERTAIVVGAEVDEPQERVVDVVSKLPGTSVLRHDEGERSWPPTGRSA